MKSFTIAMGFLLFWCVSPSRATELESIRITSVERSWERARKNELFIQRTATGYTATGKTINPKLMAELVGVLNTEPLTAPNLANLGLTPDWLQKQAKAALQEQAEKPSSWLRAQRELFIRAFSNPIVVTEIMQTYFGTWKGDDSPPFDLEVVWSDGKKTTLHATGQYPFMIPWQITRDGQSSVSFNADLSRILARLVPKKFANRAHLSGTFLRPTVAREVMKHIQEPWMWLAVEKAVGTQLEPVKKRYVLKSSSLGGQSSIDVDSSGLKKDQTNWNATLGRADLPANVCLGVSLTLGKGGLFNYQAFQERLDSVVNLTLSVPWFATQLKRDPNTLIEIRFVEDRSMSKTAQTQFHEDLFKLGKQALWQECAAQLDESAFLEIEVQKPYPSEFGGVQIHSSTSRWIVLPDKRMILWMSYGGAFNWDAKELVTCPCYGWTCTGAVISPDGTLLSR